MFTSSSSGPATSGLSGSPIAQTPPELRPLREPSAPGYLQPGLDPGGPRGCGVRPSPPQRPLPRRSAPPRSAAPPRLSPPPIEGTLPAQAWSCLPCLRDPPSPDVPASSTAPPPACPMRVLPAPAGPAFPAAGSRLPPAGLRRSPRSRRPRFPALGLRFSAGGVRPRPPRRLGLYCSGAGGARHARPPLPAALAVASGTSRSSACPERLPGGG